MKKLVLIFLLVIFTCSYVRATGVCYSYYDDLTLNTCYLFYQVFHTLAPEEDFLIEHIDFLKFDKQENKKFSIVYIAGYGNPKGFWINESKMISWCNLLKMVPSRILLVDACYSGSVFKCPEVKGFDLVITSTTENCMSINNLYQDYPVSTFSLMLNCIFKLLPECFDLPGCNEPFSPQVCQLSWILLKHEWKKESMEFLLKYPDLHPNNCIGTTLINNKPWK